MKTKFRNLIYLSSILLIFSLIACENTYETVLNKYLEPFNQTIEIIKEPDKIIELGFSNNVKTLIKLGKELIIIEYNEKNKIELKDGYEITDENFLVRDTCNSLYRIYIGDYKLKNNLLTNKKGDTLYRYTGEKKEFILPNKIKYINDYAFMRNTHLEKLTIHKTIKFQEGHAIFECENINDITIPYLYDDPSITSLEVENYKMLSVFHKNTSLRRITITKQTLFDYSFLTPSQNLEYVKIESDAKELGEIFKYTNVEIVILPNTLEIINDGTFWMCQRLKEIIIPSGVKKIGSRVFEVNMRLEKIFIPKSVEIIESDAIFSWQGVKIFCEDKVKKSTWANDFFEEPASVIYGSRLKDYLNA